MAKSLLLHNESDCRELIKRVLLENGHEVATFTEEGEALAWTRSNQVELAIISLEPGIVQNRICQELKNVRENLKILVLTSYTHREMATEALEQGADDYLLQPIEIKKLETKVKSLITGEIIWNEFSDKATTGNYPKQDLSGIENLCANLKILVLTPYTGRDLATEALEQGADDYLLKPIEIKKLEAKVKSLISGEIIWNEFSYKDTKGGEIRMLS